MIGRSAECSKVSRTLRKNVPPSFRVRCALKPEFVDLGPKQESCPAEGSPIPNVFDVLDDQSESETINLHAIPVAI
jgi:hypothetical protein